jgi:hypothetical protein
MRVRSVASVFLLLAGGRALASQPCLGYDPAYDFARIEPLALRVPADARVICGLGKEAVLREPVRQGAATRIDITRSSCEGFASCDCELPDGVAVSAGKTYLLRDARGQVLQLFSGFPGSRRSVPCPHSGAGKESALLEEVRLTAAVELTPWPDAPRWTCYSLPPRTRLDVSKNYAWRSAESAKWVTAEFQLVQVDAAVRGSPPAPPALVPRETSFQGACPAHVAVVFVPPGTPPQAVAVEIPDVAGPGTIYRWEVRSHDGHRVIGPAVGFAPRVFAVVGEGSILKSPLVLGQRYQFVVSAVDVLGRQSAPATVDFQLERTSVAH